MEKTRFTVRITRGITHSRSMLRPMLVIVCTAILLALVAVWIILWMLPEYREPRRWVEAIRGSRKVLRKTNKNDLPRVYLSPRRVSLADMLQSTAEAGEGYIAPEELPGYSHLESAAQRLEKKIYKP